MYKIHIYTCKIYGPYLMAASGSLSCDDLNVLYIYMYVYICMYIYVCM
jgi:hypothetical protein